MNSTARVEGPRVSVIIPTYNRAKLISEAVESVLRQTYKPYEIIVVDDGSTDNTEEVLKKYEGKITYLRQRNSGPSRTRNNGIRAATGELIGFLDSDDIWLPQKLEAQVKFQAGKRDVGLVASAYYRHDIVLDTQTIERQKTSTLGELTFADFLVKNRIATPTVLARKECFDRLGMFNERYIFAEDYDMWLRIARNYRVLYVTEPLCKVRILSESITRSWNYRNIENWEEVLNENASLVSSFGERVALRKGWSWLYLNRSFVENMNGNSDAELKCVGKALLTWPLQFGLIVRFFRLLLRRR
jgi:glycosyltransferase involved in cell wall biosynthesis